MVPPQAGSSGLEQHLRLSDSVVAVVVVVVVVSWWELLIAFEAWFFCLQRTL